MDIPVNPICYMSLLKKTLGGLHSAYQRQRPQVNLGIKPEFLMDFQPAQTVLPRQVIPGGYREVGAVTVKESIHCHGALV